MKILIIEPLPSLSGDMFLAAGCALGFKIAILEKVIQEMGYPDCKIKIVSRKEGHITVRSLKIFPPNLPSVDLQEMIKKISHLNLDERVKEISIDIIKRLLIVERKFHRSKRKCEGEIYSLDTVIDALGVGMLISALGIEKCFYTQIYIPRGFRANSEFPLLAPATLEILRGYHLHYTEIKEELITPTGASILTTLCNSKDKMDCFYPLKTGYATGSRKFSAGSNMLRLILAEKDPHTDFIFEEIYQLITCVDDITPEELAYAQEKLFSSGALDVQISTYYGKKNRIGFSIVVLCFPEKVNKLISVLFQHTPTSGIRYSRIPRVVLPRKIEKGDFPGKEVRIKKFRLPEGGEKYKFEFQDLQETADSEGLSISELRKILKNKLNT